MIGHLPKGRDLIINESHTSPSSEKSQNSQNSPKSVAYLPLGDSHFL